MAQFTSFQDKDYVCFTWFERDRQNIRLETPNGRVVFDLWDNDVNEALESGYLTSPRRPRPSDSDWQPHAVEYAHSLNLV